MMKILQIPTIDATDVKTILVWIITVLIIVIVGFIAFYKSERKQWKDDLKVEQDYIKNEHKDMIVLMTEVSSFMNRAVLSIDRSNENITRIENIQTQINAKLNDLYLKLVK